MKGKAAAKEPLTKRLLGTFTTDQLETERKQAEEELWKSEEKYRTLVEGLEDAIVRFALDGTILYCSPNVNNFGGYDSKEEIGQHFTKYIADEEAKQELQEFFQGIIKRKKTITFEFRYMPKSKDPFYVEAKANPIINEKTDEIVSIQCIVRDITGRKLMEEELRKYSEHLEEEVEERTVELKKVIEQLQEDITERQQAGDNPGKTSDEDRLKEQARLTPLQKRFIRSGFESLDDREIIELLISLCQPRKCQPLAEACIEQFHGLREFLSASSLELQRVGLSPSCIFSVRLLHELPEEVLKQKILEKPVYKSSEAVFDYLRYSMRDLDKEVFKVIYLNKRNAIIDTVDLFEGTLDSIPIRPREIMESAIAHNAVNLIFVHNHPTGDPSPSRTDKQLTRELVFVGLIMQIKVLDHVIIGEDKYFSFADEGLIEKYEDDFLNMRIRAAFDTGVHPTVSLK